MNNMFDNLKAETIAPPRYTSQQQIFDLVAKHLFQQGCRATTIGGFDCLYKGKHGLKCAIGALIPDTIYDPEMEFKGVGNLLHRFPAVKQLFGPDISKTFLRDIQMVHDRAANWHTTDNMRYALRCFAEDYKLSLAVLNGLSFKKDQVDG